MDGFFQNISAYAKFWLPFCFGFALILLWQVWAINKHRKLRSLMEILRYIEDIELRRARWFMYEHSEAINALLDRPLPENRKRLDTEIRKLSSDEVTLDHVELALNTLNNMAYLIRKKYAPAELVPELFQNSFLRCSKVFAGYIEYRKKERVLLPEKPSMYACHFEWLVADIKRKRPTKA